MKIELTQCNFDVSSDHYHLTILHVPEVAISPLFQAEAQKYQGALYWIILGLPLTWGINNPGQGLLP